MSKPNVLLVLTDDQGYGDLHCNGNPWIKTPNLDEFYEECVRFQDFHVAPLCAPTRGGLCSGNRPLHNGVWATCWGRSMLKKDQYTIADCFTENGYNTGLFGKWHLGDNYPYRPEDRGFKKAVAHKGGGVGQTPDYWGNNYFDDTYFHNSTPIKHSGYCTDIWFDEAMKFISENEESGKPFFAVVSTNAPHHPYYVDEKYSAQYRGNPNIPSPEFYGMVTNIDENFGKLRKFLKEKNLEDDTILMFMTDNGSWGGLELDNDQYPTQGFNAGMKGRKGSYYEGGHRVPFFIRWKNGEIYGGKDIDEMCFGIDFFPTMADLCGIKRPDNHEIDGKSFAKTFKGEKLDENRVEFIQYYQSSRIPPKWSNAVVTKRWRLIKGEELYDIKADPSQKNDIAEKHPEVVEFLRGEFEKEWASFIESGEDFPPISLGADEENPTTLNGMDIMGDVPWNQCSITAARHSTGNWRVDVEKQGEYRISLYRWPAELGIPLDDVITQEEADALAGYEENFTPKQFKVRKATLKIFDEFYEMDVEPGEKSATFKINLEKTGITTLDAHFYDENGVENGAFYAEVEKIN